MRFYFTYLSNEITYRKRNLLCGARLTATVSMRGVPVSNVPVSITLSDNGNISIMVDPKATDNHFGSTPIEGKVTA